MAFLKTSGLTKSFSGNIVLRDISLSINQGEFHGLVGENGAGKSTFINLICGIHQPDSGTIEVDGQVVKHMTPQRASDLGIGVVHQELSLLPHLTITQNIFLRRELRGRGGLLQYKRMNEVTSGLLAEVGLANLSPEEEIGRISLPQQQLVEFIKMIFQKPRLLILDEATSALDPEQVAIMFELLRKLRKSDGLCVVFITHRLGEMFSLCDTMTVLKDGMQVVTSRMGITVEEIIRYMTGRKITNLFPEKPDNESIYKKEKVMALSNVSTENLCDISFAIHKSEILGIGGLQGQGQQELMESIFGVVPITGGHVELNGQRVNFKHAATSMYDGMAYIPSDRSTESLFLHFSVRENIAFINLESLSSRLGTVNSKAEANMTTESIQRFDIKLTGMNQEIMSLSGGNQQKVVLAKWLARKPQIILLNEPTRGIDVGTKKEIYELLRKLSAEGVSIIMISTDTLELLGLCDRVVVLYEHRVNGELRGDELTEENLVHVSVVKKQVKV